MEEIPIDSPQLTAFALSACLAVVHMHVKRNMKTLEQFGVSWRCCALILMLNLVSCT